MFDNLIRTLVKSFPAIIYLIISFDASAQFYEYGQDAGNLKWNHFSSKNYQLIYPVGLDSLAMDFADKLEYFYPYQAEKLDCSHKKIPVVFHNESSFSNGVFVWAPRRLEVFTNPNPNGYPQDWLTQLVLHEGRHAFQVSKLEQGFTKGLTYIAGEQAIGAVTGLLPMWYLEGDAVDAETRFSFSGRGRQPSFEMGTKALMMEKRGPYKFSKAVLGSYKDYVPDHYQLGYLLVRYGRRTYGDEFWQDFEEYAARKPFLLSPTRFSIRKYGVQSKKQLYRDALNAYREHWQSVSVKKDNKTARAWSNTQKKYHTNYNFPQFIGNDRIIALKSGYDQIPEFVIIDSTGEEERVFRPGFMNSGRFSYSNKMIVWDEWVPDIRWSNRNYSLIRLYDVEKSSVTNLGEKTRYYSPVFAKEGDRIAVIEQQTDHTFYLVILDLEGNVLLKKRSPSDMFIQHPAWTDKDSAVVITSSDEMGEYIYSFHIGQNRWTRLYHSGYDDMSWPFVDGARIYFSSTRTGTNNIFYYITGEGSLYRVSDTDFGGFEPAVDTSGHKLACAEYHADGYDIVVRNIQSNQVAAANEVPDSTRQLDFRSTPAEQKLIHGSFHIAKGNYSPRPYRKLWNSVNVHSWLPLYFDYMHPESALIPEQLPVSLGFTILSQNLLSTVTGMMAYEYKDKFHYFHSGVRLKGRFPVIDLQTSLGGKPLVHAIDPNDEPPVGADRKRISAISYLPLRLNTGKFITVIQPQLTYIYTSDLFPNENRSGYISGSHRTQVRLYAGTYLRKGYRDILPRFGITGIASFTSAPFDQINLGSISYAGLNLYLPGILKHQTLKLNFHRQIQNPERYFMGNVIPLPRGMSDILGMDLKLFSADYTFPLLYPDLVIEPLLFLKRIRGNLWLDYMNGENVRITDPALALENREYCSYGVDLVFDFHVFRFVFPISMGGRVAYLPNREEFVPEFIFSLDID